MLLDTSGYTKVLIEGWKQHLEDRCLPTGPLTHASLTLENSFYCPGKAGQLDIKLDTLRDPVFAAD